MFLTYNEYKRMGGTLAETDFNRLSYRAEQTLKTYTFGRIEVPDERVKRCIFDLIIFANSQNSGSIQSVSNDGYSMTYKSSKEQNEAEYGIIYRYFADTDMLYCGADGVGKYEPEATEKYDFLQILNENGEYDYLMLLGESDWDYIEVLKDAS